MNLKIMVVDDNRDFCESLADVLAINGHSTLCSYDGESAITRVKTEPPDLVLLDMIMPGIDGLETLERLRKIAPKLPVIMISGFTLEDRRGEAEQRGLYAFVRKPIDFPGLLKLINNAQAQ